ncbi:MAG: acetylxylan esterase, partial [Planctomycetales bacterium]|nr:acetylxylan esterase [Planctomycetales bacterium]
RMGCVVFHYDMVGYADSNQLSYELVHRFGKQRPEAIDPKNWGLFSPQAESHLQSVMGLQIWNGVRAIDFVQSLDDVDPDKIAVTGASGGGTQTMILAAIDPRVDVSVPAVMVSTAMQGGCTCENCSLLRIDTGNVEFAALFAPKPQLLICADDWTKELRTKGFPDLAALYKTLGAADKVAMIDELQFKHNYNFVNRAAMYAFMNEHLELGLPSPIVERDFERLTQTDLTVWNDDHPAPAGGWEFEWKLLAQMRDASDKQLAKLLPHDAASLRSFKETIGGGLDIVLGREIPEPKRIDYKQSSKNDDGYYLQMAGVLNYKTPGDQQEQLPLVFLYPKDWNRQVVIWIHPRGKAGLYEEDGPIIEPVKELMRAGTCVIGVDLLHQGEFLADGQPLAETPKVKNPREAAAFSFGYNETVFAERAHDILTVAAYVKNHGLEPEEVVVVGLDGAAGPLVAAARAQGRDLIDRAVVDTHGFRFVDVKSIRDPDFLPGGAKYFDLPGMLAVAAPLPLWLAGEGEGGPVSLPGVYEAAGAKDQLTQAPSGDAAAAVKWILKK